MEHETFTRVLHPVSKHLHWKRPGADAALCQACVPAGRAWQAPFVGALYHRCVECEQSVTCWLRAAQAVTLALPGREDAS